MDFDGRIAHYKEFERLQPVIVDYSFPTYIVHAFKTGTTHALVNHVKNTTAFGQFQIQRPVRTHDGVLMRSIHQPADSLAQVVKILQEHGCHLRYTNGVLYECNNSLPFLLNIDDSANLYYRKIASALILAELTSDSSYMYAGSLLGDVPERDRQFSQAEYVTDPRELQRRAIDLSLVRGGPWAHASDFTTTVNLMSDSIASVRRNRSADDIQISEVDGVIDVERKSLGLRALLNFTDKTVPVQLSRGAIISVGATETHLGPYGYIVCQTRKEAH